MVPPCCAVQFRADIMCDSGRRNAKVAEITIILDEEAFLPRRADISIQRILFTVARYQSTPPEPRAANYGYPTDKNAQCHAKIDEV
eukprot:m.140265 g.140265  ORF g.140265 m.140265 type:complete len:86 (+) comp17655_c0_seq1:1316-1573(+)